MRDLTIAKPSKVLSREFVFVNLHEIVNLLAR